MASPKRADLEEAARSFFEALTQQVDRPRHPPEGEYRQFIAYQVHLSDERIGELDRHLAINDYEGDVRKMATELLASVGAEAADLQSQSGMAAQQLAARAMRQQMRYFIHQLTTPHLGFEPDDDVFRGALDGTPKPTPAPLAQVPAATGGLSLSAAAAEYLRKKKLRGLGQSQIDETRRLLDWLEEEFGPGRPVASLRMDELRKFRDDLQRIDVTLRGRPGRFQDRLTNVAERQVKSATYLRYWNATRGFTSWCFSEGYAPADPAAGLKIDKKKGEAKRTPAPFTKDELLRLFKMPLFTGYKSRSRLRDVGPHLGREGHWWAAVLLMFTGMRAGELSQLLPGDFDFAGPIPHLKVRDEDEAGRKVKSTKNAASVRDVPLHPHLITLGLPQFVAARGKKYPKDRVFREFRVAGKGRWSDGMTRFWRDYLHEAGLWKEGRATHVWRHTVVACLRANGAAEEDIAAFVGHAGGTVTSGYGGAQPLERKAKTCALLEYGFDPVAVLGGAFAPSIHAV